MALQAAANMPCLPQGLSLIFGIMRLVNLAHGDFLILAAYILLALSWVLGALGIPAELNIFLALILATPILAGLAMRCSGAC